MANVNRGFVVIGAQAIFFSITNLRTLEELERGQYPIDVGQDVYETRRIAAETVDSMVTALDAIGQLFSDYGIKDQTVVASHSFFEAINAQFVWDQLLSRTGWQIQHATLAQEAFYRTQAVYARFPHFRDITQVGTVLVDISSGSVELAVFHHGEFGFSRNLSIGPLRVFEVMSDLQATVPNYVEVMRDYIDSRLVDFMRLMPSNIKYHNMIVMGSSMSLLETLIPSGQLAVETDREGFELIYDEVTHASDQYLMDVYGLPNDQVSQVLPTVMLVWRLAKALRSDQIWLSNLKMLDGIEVNVALDQGYKPVDLDPTKEIVVSAMNLASRYRVDPAHRDATVTFALQLFDRLKKLHGMGKRERLLLQVAAIVTDIGSFVATHKHYQHSDYLIRASELVGLTAAEQQIVATIARFHSSNSPQTDLGDLPPMDAGQRLLIAKLSAILRVADSLDASRLQKIQSIRVSLRDDKVVIMATANDELALERWTLQRKGRFFEDVYGILIELKGKTRI